MVSYANSKSLYNLNKTFNFDQFLKQSKMSDFFFFLKFMVYQVGNQPVTCKNIK